MVLLHAMHPAETHASRLIPYRSCGTPYHMHRSMSPASCHVSTTCRQSAGHKHPAELQTACLPQASCTAPWTILSFIHQVAPPCILHCTMNPAQHHAICWSPCPPTEHHAHLLSTMQLMTPCAFPSPMQPAEHHAFSRATLTLFSILRCAQHHSWSTCITHTSPSRQAVLLSDGC